MDLMTTLEKSSSTDIKFKSKFSRNSSIELLRIISIIFIIGHHFAIHSNFIVTNDLTINNLWLKFLSIGGKWGVNLFVFISSYFSINSIYKLQKIFKFILQVIFYSVLLMLIMVRNNLVFLNKDITFTQALIKAVLCIPFEEYWFATSYFLLMIFIPYINKMLVNITEKQHLQLIFILIILWSVFPILFSAQFDFNDIGWFITLHLIATYIKMYPKKFFKNNLLMFIIAIIPYILTMLIILNSKTLFNNYILSNSPLILISSIATFILFTNFKFYNKIINTIATTTFGIYLIHDNKYVRPYLWLILCKGKEHINHSDFVIYSIVCILLIFITCSVIEYIRINILERFIFKIPLLLKPKR